eukprot:4487858-Karenia_brevis.AAC.1
MPQLSGDDVKAKVFDCILLALMGLAVVANGRVAVAAYPQGSLDFLRACNRLQDWDNALEVAALRAVVPLDGPKACIVQEAADEAFGTLNKLCLGESAVVDTLRP